MGQVPSTAERPIPAADPGRPAFLWWPLFSPQAKQGNGSETEFDVALDDRIGSDVAFFELVLMSPGVAPAVRQAAANRLVRNGTGEALQAVERALRSSDLHVGSAALAAVDRSGIRLPRLAEALAGLATSPGAIDRGAAARALAAADPRASERIAAVATDVAAAIPRRVAAIETLAELSGRDAQAALIALLAEGRVESAEIQSAAIAALERSTGERRGSQPAAWRLWWSGTQTLPSEGELAEARERARIATTALSEERRLSATLSERLIDVYAQLFNRLTPSAQFERAGQLLSDTLLPVQTFAVGQIERLLRNGERPTDATLVAATVLLDDRVPALRARAARLLDDMGLADLPKRLVERVPNEKDPDVLAAYLAVLVNRPDAATFEVVAPLVRHPTLSEEAARVLSRALDRNAAPEGWQAAMLPILREAVETRPNGKVVQLLAAGGEPKDLERVMVLLDSGDPAIRRGAAEGLRRRGLRDPLLARAADPAIYVPLVAAIAEGGRDIEVVRTLALHPPPPDARREWNAAIESVIKEIPVTSLLEADEILAGIPASEPATRLVGLARCLRASRGDEMDRVEVREGLERYVDLAIGSGRARDALTAIAALSPDPDEPLFDALFRARLLSGDFDGGMRLKPAPKAWIDLLQDVIDDPTSARPLAKAISERFGASLEGDDAAAFAELQRALPAEPGARATSAVNGLGLSGGAADR